jgi:aspartyl-tRNA(Asn)/glutamyl-tRNA(Gln) amidotransferase subunit C
MGERMKIAAADVRHVARLAELAVADADVEQLARELEAIVNFVAQLDLVPAQSLGGVVVGPAEVALRDDVVRPIAMTAGPASFAPAFDHGFFVVPRLGGSITE